MILSNSKVLHIKKGQTLIRQGDYVSNFLLVKEGEIKVFARTPYGKEVILYYIKPSQTCVLTTSSLLGHDSFPAEAVAVTDSKLEVISNEEFDSLLETSSEIRNEIFNNFGDRLRSLILRLEAISGGSIPQRISRLLLENIQTKDCIDSDAIAINEVNITHEGIANQIGSSREVVSRTLKKMETLGQLTLKRGVISILNISELESYL